VINLKTARTLGLSLTTGQGSPIWAGFETRRASVQALREAGAVIVGKTVSTEFALISWSATPSIFRGLVRVPWPV
jgi:Asp-tRNA(Asn)/Glu-tRNA(Gln) amidotransferase A subunit family amidase